MSKKSNQSGLTTIHQNDYFRVNRQIRMQINRRIKRLTTADGSGYLPRLSLENLAIAAVVLHGPIDVSVTFAAWHLESNPIVLELGPAAWAAIKILALMGIPFALQWIEADARFPGDRAIKPHARTVAATAIVLNILLAVGLILPNIPILAAVMGGWTA